MAKAEFGTKIVPEIQSCAVVVPDRQADHGNQNWLQIGVSVSPKVTLTIANHFHN